MVDRFGIAVTSDESLHPTRAGTIGSPAELAEQLVVEVIVRDLDRSLANVRILTSDVDAVYATVLTLGVRVERPIADRSYGLRDFTVRDPDGFELRFAKPLGRGSDAAAS